MDKLIQIRTDISKIPANVERWAIMYEWGYQDGKRNVRMPIIPQDTIRNVVNYVNGYITGRLARTRRKMQP